MVLKDSDDQTIIADEKDDDRSRKVFDKVQIRGTAFSNFEHTCPSTNERNFESGRIETTPNELSES